MGTTKTVLAFVLSVFWTSFVYAEVELVWQGRHIQAAKVSGDPYDRGYDAVKLSNVGWEDSMARHMIASSDQMLSSIGGTGFFSGIIKFLTFTYYTNFIVSPMRGTIGDDDRSMLKGMADAYGIGSKYLRKAFVSPDISHYLASIAISSISDLDKFHLPLNCSSFSVGDDLTKNGDRILARNFDFTGIDVVDKHVGVYLAEPIDGKYKVLTVGPLGIPSGSISAMNEKGLVMVLHSAMTKDTTASRGEAILQINREMMENVATIEEAIAFLKKRKFLTGWFIHLSDRDPSTGKARSVVVETTYDRLAVVKNEKQYTVLANRYRTSLKNDELYAGYSTTIHSLDREKRLSQLVEQQPVDLDRAVEILQDSYSFEAGKQVEASPSAIRGPDQLNSMVFLPDEGKILVAEGGAPSSINEYRVFSFDQMEKGLAPETYVPHVTETTEATKHYVRAYKLHDLGDHGSEFQKQIELAHQSSADCSYSLIYGAQLLKQKRWSEAEKILGEARKCSGYNQHAKSVASYFAGLNYLAREDGKRNPAKASAYFMTAISGGKNEKFIKRVQDKLEDKSISMSKLLKEVDISPKYLDKYVW